MVRLVLVEQPLDIFTIAIETLALVVRSLVVVERQPFHAVEDGVHGRLGGTLAIRVLDAQYEYAAVAAGEQPAEQRRAGAPDVKISRRTRGKAGAYRHGDSTFLVWTKMRAAADANVRLTCFKDSP